MKHLKIYEDFGFDKPTIHEDDDLFDDLVTQLGTNTTFSLNSRNYWRRDTDNRQDGFHIRWKNQEPLKIEEEDYEGKRKISERHFEIEKIKGDLKNILDSKKPDKYNCWLESSNDKLDVSEEKIKSFYDKLELINNTIDDKHKKDSKEKRQIATFTALRKREDEIIDKEAKKYNV